MSDSISPRDDNKKHYVYGLYYPASMGGGLFYVGKGTNGRINSHEWEAQRGVKSHKCNVIRLIWAAGEQIVKQKLAFFETHEEACWYEKALIFGFRWCLTNKTAGGDGGWGVVRNEEYRRKMSEANSARLRKYNEERRGKPLSEEHKRKAAEGRKLRGAPVSEETRRKIGETLRSRTVSEETRRKLSEKGKTVSEETRRKLSEASRRSWKQREVRGRGTLSDEYRRKLSEAAKNRSEETRRKISENNRNRAMSEKNKRNLREMNLGKKYSQEHRRKLSEAQKRRWERERLEKDQA